MLPQHRAMAQLIEAIKQNPRMFFELFCILILPGIIGGLLLSWWKNK